LSYPELTLDAGKVLQTLVPAEKPIVAKDGRWFTVRIMPYRTLDNRIDGVVITFADISAGKAIEASLADKHASLKERFAKQSSMMKKSRQTSRTNAKTKRVKNRAGKPPAGRKKEESLP